MQVSAADTKTREFAWRGYNCFSSAVGTLLRDAGATCIHTCMDSCCDFYYSPGATAAGRREAGVWPGAEHGAIYKRLPGFYRAQLVHRDDPDYRNALERVSRRATEGRLSFLAVVNRAWPYIPMSTEMGTDWHYVVLCEVGSRAVQCYDPFFDRCVSVGHAELQQAADFRVEGSPAGRNRVYSLRSLGGPPRLTPCGERYARLLSGLCLSPAERLAHEEGDMTFGPEGIRLLAQALLDADGRGMRRRLLVLSQCFKDVHYQRVFFARFLREARRHGVADELVAGVETELADVTDRWFRIKIATLYAARRQRGDTLRRLSKMLCGAADAERALLGSGERLAAGATDGHSGA